jgi:hypothetical protein
MRLGEGESVKLILKDGEGVAVQAVTFTSMSEFEKGVSLTVPTAEGYTLVILKEDGVGNIISEESHSVVLRN